MPFVQMTSSAQQRKAACRPMLRRFYWLARTLRAKGELPTARAIGARQEYSYKTIYRDMELLRDFFDYPIAYDKSSHKWRLTGPLPEPVL